MQSETFKIVNLFSMLHGLLMSSSAATSLLYGVDVLD